MTILLLHIYNIVLFLDLVKGLSLFGPGSDAVLENGMIISVDIPMFNTPWGGIRIEDGYLMTESGVERLINLPCLS